MKNMSDYFTPETDVHIKNYIETKIVAEKHKIFVEYIKPAFEKLIESQIHVYRFYSISEIETLKRDALANLYEVLPKFDPSRGKKSFSYFNVVCKRWFIQKIREKDKLYRGAVQQDGSIDLDHEIIKNVPSFSMSPLEDEIVDKEFWKSLYENMDLWKKKLTKKTEKQVLEAVIFILQNPGMISIYNKKAIYLYLRDLTGLNTKQVVVNLNKIKNLYDKFKNEFDTYGHGENEDG